MDESFEKEPSLVWEGKEKLKEKHKVDKPFNSPNESFEDSSAP